MNLKASLLFSTKREARLALAPEHPLNRYEVSVRLEQEAHVFSVALAGNSPHIEKRYAVEREFLDALRDFGLYDLDTWQPVEDGYPIGRGEWEHEHVHAL